MLQKVSVTKCYLQDSLMSRRVGHKSKHFCDQIKIIKNITVRSNFYFYVQDRFELLIWKNILCEILCIFDKLSNHSNQCQLTISLRSWMKNCFLLNDILTIFALKNFGKIKVVLNNIWKKKSLGNVLSYIIQNSLDLMALWGLIY